MAARGDAIGHYGLRWCLSLSNLHAWTLLGSVPLRLWWMLGQGVLHGRGCERFREVFCGTRSLTDALICDAVKGLMKTCYLFEAPKVMLLTRRVQLDVRFGSQCSWNRECRQCSGRMCGLVEEKQCRLPSLDWRQNRFFEPFSRGPESILAARICLLHHAHAMLFANFVHTPSAYGRGNVPLTLVGQWTRTRGQTPQSPALCLFTFPA